MAEQKAELERLKAAGRGTEDQQQSVQDAELQQKMLALSERFEQDRAVILAQEEELRQVKAESASERAALEENIKSLALTFEEEIQVLYSRQQEQQREMRAAHELELQAVRERLTVHLQTLTFSFEREREALQAQQQQQLEASAQTEAHKAESLQSNLTTLAKVFESEVSQLTLSFEAEREELQKVLKHQKMELESAVLSEAEQQQQAAALKQELSKITDKLEKDRATFLEQEEELARLKTEVPVACLASACVCQSSPVCLTQPGSAHACVHSCTCT